MKNKKKFNIFFIIVPLAIVLLILTFLFFKIYSSQNTNNETVETGIRTPYRIPANPTEFQRQTFKQLQESYANNSQEQVALHVGQLMLSDFFTLSNKNSRNELGGIDYILNDQDFRKAFFSQAMANYYGFLEELKIEYGKDQLPTVTNVTWTYTQPGSFEYLDFVFEDVVTMSFTLEFDQNLAYDVTDFHLDYALTLVLMEGVWYVVEINIV